MDSIGHALNKSNSNAAVSNIPPSSHSKVRPVNTYGDFSGLSERAGVKEEQIIAVNLEGYDFYELHEPARLYAYIKERISQGYRTYVFLDEIQHCEDFPGVVDSLSIKRNVDVYLTGFNAYMLSGEIATLISGRYVEIKMLPLSFSEYVSAVGIGEGLQRRYTEYLTMGSFPYTLEFKGKTRENSI